MTTNVGKIVVKLNLDTAAYEQGIKSAVGNINVLSSALGVLGIGFGAVQIKEFIVDMSQVSVKMDGLTNKFNAAAGGAQYGASSMQFVRDESKKLGLILETTAESFSGFEAAALRSGLTMNETKEIFDNIARAATSLHLSGEKTGLVFTALEQMASKGVVSMEELRRQLGDSLPGAFEIAAKAMGVSTAQFNKMVSNGEVMSADFLPKFARAIREELGGEAEKAATQANAAFNRYENSIFNISDAIGDVLNPTMAELATNATGLVEGLEGDIRAFQDWAAVNQETINSVKNLGLALATTATVFSSLVVVAGRMTKAYTSATAAIKAVEAATIASEISTKAAAEATIALSIANKEVENAERALYAARLLGDEAMIKELVLLRSATSAKVVEAEATVAATSAKVVEAQATVNSTRVTVAQYLATGNLTSAFKLAIVSVREFTLALLANPWTWVALGIGAVVSALYAYKNNAESTKKAIDDLNATQDQNVDKTVTAIQTLKELGGAKNLDYEQTKRLDAAISYLTEKYPNYIGKLKQELKLKGEISRATAEQIANEMTLAKVKGLQQARVSLNKDMQRDMFLSNIMGKSHAGGRYGITKSNQKRDDSLNAERKKLEAERKAIIEDLAEINKPTAISGFDNTPVEKKKKGKTANQLAAEEKRRQKEALDYKIALLDIEKYKTKQTDEEIYQIELEQANLKIAAAKKGTSDYAQALSAKLKLERDHEEKLNGLKSQQVVDTLEYNKQELDSTNSNLELEYQAGQISKVKMLELEISNINQKKDLEREALAEQLKLVEGNAAEEVKIKRASNREIESLERERRQKSVELQASQRVSFKDFSADVSSGWGNTVSSLIKGDTELSGAFDAITGTMLDAFGNYCGKSIELWLESNLTKENITKTFALAKVAWDNLMMGSNAAVAGSNAAVAGSNVAVAGSSSVVAVSNTTAAATSAGLATANVALSASNAAVAVSSTTAAATTAASSGVMAGAAATMGVGITAIVAPVTALAAAFATLALSTTVVALTMPIIAISTMIVALGSALAALGLGFLNVVMGITMATSLLFAPVSLLLAAEFAIIGVAAELASIAVAHLAIALAAASAAAIPVVGWALAPAAATMTGAAIMAANSMVQFRETGGPVKKGQAYVVGEKRPELFVPDRDGTILPNTNAIGGGGGRGRGGDTYHLSAPVTILATDAKSFEDRLDEFTEKIHSNLHKGIKKRKLKPLVT